MLDNFSKYPEAAEFCKKNYPNHRASLAEVECGDVAIVYLHDLDHNWLQGCKVVYWNQWYPGEFNVYNLTPVDF